MTKKLHDSMTRPLVEDDGAGGHEPYVRLDDGGIPALGTTTDTPFVGTEDGTARGAISLLKGIKNTLYVSLLAILGATNGAAVVTDADGTIQQYLRGLVKLLVDKITVNTDPKAATPTPYNVTCTVADTEYSQALPANCRGFEFQARTEAAVRFAFATGKVAGSVAPFLTLKAGDYYSSPPVAQAASPSTLYVASPTAGTVVEILAWT